MDPTILKSLQEIASLLLIVHDDYLKGATGHEVVSALYALIRDVGLTSKVSVLDIERLRREVMGDGDNEMGYELFYDWLRGVGLLVAPDKEAAGKKALHHLLTQHIIPFASSMGAKASEFDLGSRDLPPMSGQIMRIMTIHDDFLGRYFHEIARQVS